jgi:hypothetical protein
LYGNKSHAHMGLMIKSKINTKKSQSNESYSQDKNSKTRTSLSSIEKNKFVLLLTGKEINWQRH